MLWVFLIMAVLYVLLKLLVPTEDEKKHNKAVNAIQATMDEIGVKYDNSHFVKRGDGMFCFILDDESKTVYYLTPKASEDRYYIRKIPYSELAFIQDDRDDATIVSENGTGKAIGRAVVGGVLAGGIGAAVGGMTAKGDINAYHNKLNIIVNLKSGEKITLRCLYGKTPAKENEREWIWASSVADRVVRLLSSAIEKAEAE